MKVWLTQRAEPTPHDQLEQRRPMRTGLMAEYLSDHGEDVLWWTGDYDHYGQRQRGHGNAQIPVSDKFAIRYLDAPGYTKTKSLARVQYDRKVASGFEASCRETEPPDIIIASMPSVDLALASVRFGKACGVPVVVDIRDLHPEVFVEAAPTAIKPWARLATWPMKRKVAELCRDATAIWGNSDAFVDWGCRMGGRPRGEQDLTLPIAYKPLSVESEEMANIKETWAKQGLFLPQHLHGVFFGTLSKAFDFGPLFQAAKHLNEQGTRHRFHIFGAGQQQPDISHWCAALDNCTFHGPVGAAKLQMAMELSHVGFAPYVFSENFASNMPNKTTEYLGGGLPVALAFKTGVLADFLNATGSGFCYETSGELIDALVALDREPGKLDAIRDAAKRSFEVNLGYESLSRRMHDKLVATVASYSR
ncbi:hypothetical protein A8B78_01835 [Jannaschia sp. EhC01]|nr:hypothetical protein A8B78_01835 [Jannaschia sp. EhC01]